MKKAEEQTTWIIRWKDLEPQKMECRHGTLEEVKAYAAEKSKEVKSGYVIA